MQLPSTAPVAVMTGVGTIEIQDRRVPKPEGTDVLVEILSVGVCGSDIHWFTDGRIGNTFVTAPLVLGHEASGRIAATGPEATLHTLGQRVAVEPGIPCRRCQQCKSGHYNLCPEVKFFATPPIDGAFSRYVVVPEDFAHPVPDVLSDDEAALIEPLSVALWAVRKANVAPGESVLITGAGAVGLLSAQVARLAGATAVTVTDISDERLKRAAEFGATHTINTSNTKAVGQTEAAVLIECSGSAVATRDALSALLPAGRAVLVGMSASPDLALPLDLIQQRELLVTGTFRYANTYPAAIKLAASGAVNLGALVTSHHSLENTADALAAPGADPTAIKAIVRPQENPGATHHANNR